MATESNAGFRIDETLEAVMNRHAISFQFGAVNSSSEMIRMGGYFGVSTHNDMMRVTPSDVVVPGNGNVSASSASSVVLDSVPSLRQEAGFAVDWSSEEQFILEEGLEKFKNEPRILRFIKIAATLRDKTVRDVALRSRWTARKIRKPEKYNTGKKGNNRKEKLVESSAKMIKSSSRVNSPSALTQNIQTYSPMMHHVGLDEGLQFQGVSSRAMHLIEENAQAFSQITANHSTYKLQDNINLFCQTRKNITAILNYMRNVPGIMSQMPPLPISIDEDLANSILTNMTESIVFASPNGINLKQEKWCL